MIHILLTILKIVLCIVLGILGLILLIILLALFAPVRYKIDGAYYGKARITAKVSFLMVSIKVFFDQEQSRLTKTVRICGIRLGKRDNKTNKRKRKQDNEISTIKQSCEADDVNDDGARPEALNSNKDDIDQGYAVESESQILTELNHDEENSGLSGTFDIFSDETLTRDEKSGGGRIRVLIKRIKDKLKYIKRFTETHSADSVCEAFNNKLKKVKRSLHRLDIFWNMKCTVKTRIYLKKYLVSVIRHIGPQSIKGKIHFGFDEPYKTGRVIGFMSVLPVVYQKNLYWEPDFYNEIMEGEAEVKGRVRLGYILRIALNINIWKTIKAFSKMRA